MFTINVIMIVIDEFQQLNLFIKKKKKKELTLTWIYDYAQLSTVVI